MIKLSKLPDRTPVKLTIAILPDLHRQLSEYAVLYCEAYGVEEPVIELIPHMLGAFLASDRRFSRARPPKAGGA
jgi:hypothetical protein